mmetsp:Transcript_40101/g.90907  ORF Transcript_40101/g.90907 Transcript_40101/m.90907 type:complete len:224 (+) Transcript_40101:479-1150(+)
MRASRIAVAHECHGSCSASQCVTVSLTYRSASPMPRPQPSETATTPSSSSSSRRRSSHRRRRLVSSPCPLARSHRFRLGAHHQPRSSMHRARRETVVRSSRANINSLEGSTLKLTRAVLVDPPYAATEQLGGAGAGPFGGNGCRRCLSSSRSHVASSRSCGECCHDGTGGNPCRIASSAAFRPTDPFRSLAGGASLTPLRRVVPPPPLGTRPSTPPLRSLMER